MRPCSKGPRLLRRVYPNRAFRITCLTVGILCLGGSLQVQAQTSSAAITGTIRDEAGAVIPDADLELTNIETGITVGSASNSVGKYNFLNILPGSYTLGATKDGFRPAAVEPFTLQVNQTATFDIVLEVGAVTETFTVEALGAQIQVQTSEIGNVVAERQVVDLPLNGRNFFQPNVTPFTQY
ncbi:MAG: carboxypeptidase-like regulatory domain-containing protein [Bryobacterales bacterium]|nr:carboxypeptidase-like regulatory domain-containing protein [Bryobacterales bacterium]